MGCGGSKEDVATGNTLTRRLLKKKSDSVKSEMTTSTQASSSNQENGLDIADNGSISGKAVNDSISDKADPAKAKDETSPPMATEAKEAEEKIEEKSTGDEGKLILNASPGDFFSPRKDEEQVKDSLARRLLGSEGAEYYSPPPEPEVEKIDPENGLEESKEIRDLAVEATVFGEEEAMKAGLGTVSEGREKPAAGEDGEEKSKDLVDSKEPTLVEEKKSEVIDNVEKKNEGEGGDSLPQ